MVIPRVGAPLVLVLAAFCTQVPAAQTARARRFADQPRPLAAGPGIDRELTTGQSHAYRLFLLAGDYLHVTIAQRGIDVVATLVRPDGRDLISVDAADDDFRSETVVTVADADGGYTLVVRPVASTSARGRYTIRVDDLRPAAAGDHDHVEAERAFERGRALRASGRPAAYSEALDEFRASLSRYRQLGDRQGEMKAQLEVGTVQRALAEREGLASAQQTERIARELGDDATRAAALRLAGVTIYERLGDPTAALRTLEESTDISRAIGNRKAESWSLVSEGVVYGKTGDLEQAIARFERALPLARATGDRPMESAALNNLGVTYKNAGEFARALDVNRQALARTHAANDLKLEATVLNNMGNLQHLLGHDQEALELHRRALALSRETGGRENEARSLNTIGQTYYALGAYAKALDYHRESLDIRRQINDLPGQATSLNDEGRAWHRLGDTGQALAALGESLTMRRNIRERITEMDTLRDLALVERDRGNLVEALGHIRESVDLEEALRERITSPELRTAFVAAGQDKYERFIDLLEQQHRADPSGGDDAAALHVSERARARVLLDSLLDAHVDLRQGIDPELLDRERAVQRQLNDASGRLSRALAANSRSEQSVAASQEVDDLNRSYQQVQGEIRRLSPRYAAVTQPQPLGAVDIQHTVVDADTVLLEFALGDERSWLWAVTSDTVASVELPPRPIISAAVRALYEGFARQRRPGEDADAFTRRVAAADGKLRQEAAAVSQMLLGGFADPLNHEWRGKRLAIVATGTLEYLPFAALPDPESNPQANGARPTTPRPRRAGLLVAQHEIVNIPSASVLAVLRRETAGRRPASRTIAILADPVFDAADPRVSSRPTTANIGSPPAPARTNRKHLRDGLARLPFSRKEANAIASFASPSEVFKATDFKASRATALAGTLAGYRIVHFATHGVLDNQRPSLSALVLSTVDAHGAPRDGYLRLHDIYNLRLNADLVVLSACQTALGKEIKGEGLVGLARAFMYAGAPRIVASLWEVSDLATAELMRKFYRGVLQERLTPAAALRAAQLDMRRDSRWTSPYYWAGFVLQGDWQ